MRNQSPGPSRSFVVLQASGVELEATDDTGKRVDVGVTPIPLGLEVIDRARGDSAGIERGVENGLDPESEVLARQFSGYITGQKKR